MNPLSTNPQGYQISSANWTARVAPVWLTREEDDEWDAFATQHPLGLVYHLCAWRNALEHAFPHISARHLVLRERNTGEILAGLPVYTVKSWLLGNRMVSVPFASFSDPLVGSAAEFRVFLPAIRGEFGRRNGRRLSVRTRATAADFADELRTPDSVYKHHYLLLDKSQEELFAGFDKTSIRQKVRKAINAGVTVVEATGSESIRTCHAILSQTRINLALPPIPIGFYLAMERFLAPRHLRIFLAMHDGKPVACHLVLTHKDLWISEYSGNAEGAIHGVNQLLYWETITRAHAAGAGGISFGRTSAANAGLMAYKRRWATFEEDLAEFAVLADDEARPSSDRGAGNREDNFPYRALQFLLKRAPGPVCKLVGDFCYRHLG